MTNQLDDDFFNQTKKRLSALTKINHSSEGNQVFADMMAARRKHDKVTLPVQLEKHSNGEGLKTLIQDLSQKLINCLPEDVKQKLLENTRIECIHSREVFGFLSSEKSSNRAVIAISTGFMILLSKLVKFDLAIMDPSKVIYCNRYKVDDLDIIKLKKMRNIVLEQYGKGDSRGPIITLKNDFETSMSLFQLLTQEAFIVAHEIAHYLDLRIFENTFETLIAKYAKDKIKNDNFLKEFAADALGMALLIRSDIVEKHGIWKGKIPDNFKTSVLCSSICHFFDYLSVIGQTESESHPHPMDRLENILWWCFGPEISNAYYKWHKDGRQVETYPNWYNIPTTSEGLNILFSILDNSNDLHSIKESLDELPTNT